MLLLPQEKLADTSLIPDGHGELLALLFTAQQCCQALEQAELSENYAACAKWLKAMQSGLPFIPNAIKPFGKAHPLYQDTEVTILCEVNTIEELLFVLQQVADYWSKNRADAELGFAVNHLTVNKYGYWFAAARILENDQSKQLLLPYEGRFSS